MQKIQNIFHFTLIGTLLSHIFCCGLPTVVSILSLISGLGFVVSMPFALERLHEFLHQYELHIMVFSGFMVVLGWVLHEFSRRMDCHDTGCHHPPCDTKKNRSTKVLIFASALFCINLVIYFGFSH